MMRVVQTLDTSGPFFKLMGGHMCPILGPLVPLFWISGHVSSGFQSQRTSALFACFAEANVMYIP